MLFKYGNITIAVLHKGKDAYYTCTVYEGTQLLKACEVNLDAWESDDNCLMTFLSKKHMISYWKQLNDEHTDTVDRILASVRDVFDYGIQSGADIHIGDDVFRLDKDSYISSKAFQIWYIGTKKRIPVINEKEWKEFVAACLGIAEKKMYDPLAPEVIDNLVTLLKQGEIHSDFCDALARDVSANAGGTYFVYRRSDNFALYVPKHICEGIRKQHDIGTKKARQYWEPFLDGRKEDSPRIGTTIPYGERPKKRFWIFSMEKLTEYDSTLSQVLDDVIDCEKEHNEEVEVNVGK